MAIKNIKSSFHATFLIGLLTVFILSACGRPAPVPSVSSAPSVQTRVLDTPESRELKGWQRPYLVNGERYDPLRTHEGFVEEGRASWYGDYFHGRKTSNGEIYDMHAMTAAHKTLPMGVYVKVRNLENGRETVVRINDRGPFVQGRIIDLSYASAKELDVVRPGTAPVRVEALGYRSTDRPGPAVYQQPASYSVGVFTVQVGAFTVPENANRLAAQLRERYGAATVAEGTVGGTRFYRVRVGRYSTLEAAENARYDMEIKGYPNSFVIAME